MEDVLAEYDSDKYSIHVSIGFKDKASGYYTSTATFRACSENASSMFSLRVAMPGSQPGRSYAQIRFGTHPLFANVRPMVENYFLPEPQISAIFTLPNADVLRECFYDALGGITLAQYEDVSTSRKIDLSRQKYSQAFNEWLRSHRMDEGQALTVNYATAVNIDNSNDNFPAIVVVVRDQARPFRVSTNFLDELMQRCLETDSDYGNGFRTDEDDIEEFGVTRAQIALAASRIDPGFEIKRQLRTRSNGRNHGIDIDDIGSLTPEALNSDGIVSRNFVR